MICKYCGKEIHQDEKQVLLKTTKGEYILEEFNFHYQCWLDDYWGSVDNKVNEYATKMMDFAKPSVEKIAVAKGMLVS